MRIALLAAELLDPLSHAAVQIAAARVENAFVGDITQQRVAKQVGQLALLLGGKNQLDRDQLAQAFV
ncbi:hypothetical protein HC891_12765 [Candidatus Gracilibacteria bacterium]|nr:hypothetical protein [Candidatus Gracilibacteria bacterium]